MVVGEGFVEVLERVRSVGGTQRGQRTNSLVTSARNLPEHAFRVCEVVVAQELHLLSACWSRAFRSWTARELRASHAHDATRTFGGALLVVLGQVLADAARRDDLIAVCQHHLRAARRGEGQLACNRDRRELLPLCARATRPPGMRATGYVMRVRPRRGACEHGPRACSDAT